MPSGMCPRARPGLRLPRLAAVALLVAGTVPAGWRPARAQQAAPPSPPIAAAPSPASSPSPAPAGSTPTPAANTTPIPSPAPTPPMPGVPRAEGAAPVPPELTQDKLVETLNPGELQEAINLLRANYIRPSDVDDRALARATLTGLLARLDRGAMLLPKPSAGTPPAGAEAPADTFRADTLDRGIGYVRFGAFTRDHLGDLDRALKGFADKGAPALLLDLRATGARSDSDLAADVIRSFVPKGKPLFTLRKPSNNQERLFTSNGDPAYSGAVLVAVDGDTAGAAEVVAAVIRNYDRALVVGANSAGQAVEFADLRLSGGSLLRVAVSQVLLPANLSIFPDGVKPDLAVKMPRADKLAVFRQSLEKGMAAFVDETERPRFNEAALVSGVNPELDAARDAQAARRRGEPPPKAPLRDLVIQRALDIATTISTLDRPPVR